MQRERQELGRPRGSTAETQLRNDLAQGIRLLSHEKGNPDTEARRSLNGENASSDASGGKRVRPKEEAPKIRGESDPLIVLGDKVRRLAAAKSPVIPFSRNGEPFDFLGFHWGKHRAGKPHLKRRTSRQKLRNSLSNFTPWCKQSRHTPM